MDTFWFCGQTFWTWFHSIPWFAWIPIVAILAWAITSVARTITRHLERMEKIRHGVDPDRKADRR